MIQAEFADERYTESMFYETYRCNTRKLSTLKYQKRVSNNEEVGQRVKTKKGKHVA